MPNSVLKITNRDDLHPAYLDEVSPHILEQYGKALDIGAIVSIADTSGKITYVNHNFCIQSGYSKKELIGQNHAITRHPETMDATYEELWKTISSGNVYQGILKNLTNNGETFVTHNSIVPIKDHLGEIIEYICIRSDITQEYKQQNFINNQFIDKVTLLPNSMKLIADSDKLINTNIAVLTIPELDKIQSVYTIEFYNKLVHAITNFISPGMPKGYTLYRLSENMFAISSPKNSSFDDLISCCYLLQFNFDEQQINIDSTIFKFSVVIGLAKHAKTENTLINAKMALSYALDSGLNISTFKQEDLVYEKTLNAIAWGYKIKDAIKKNNVCIFGQNIVDKKGNVIYTEVLMRIFDDEKKEYISPFHFLSIAKKANLYHQLSQQILTKAIRHFSKIKRHFSVNLSSEDVKNSQTRRLLVQLLNEYQAGHLITIELVESELCNINSTQFTSFIAQLKSLGCKLAIDDFGSGYSNFDYLLALPIDILKIDGSLIKDISKNEKHCILVESIINLSHRLNLKVVAEFISNEEDFTQVSKLNAHYYQGYYFHQPEVLIDNSVVNIQSISLM